MHLLCPLDHPTEQILLPLQHANSSQPSSLSGTDSHQHEETTTSHAAPDAHRTSAARLARLNTVSRQTSPTHPEHSALPSHNGHIADEHAHRRSESQSASTSNAASSALSQLLQSDTQASTGTPMARDLTEALTALASNKRLLSSMQASRSFSSPDLLSLAQQLHDSGQWPAVQDMVQQEEDEWSHDHAQAQASSGHANYGTVVGRPHMASAHDQGRTFSIQPVCQQTCFKKCAASVLGFCNAVAETHFDCHALHMWKHGMLYWVVVLHGLFYLCPWLSLAHSKIQPVHTVRCSLFTGPHQLAVCRSHHIPCISHPAGQPHEWQVVP